MARTPSQMVPLGSAAPDFALTDAVGGGVVKLADFRDRPLLVMFICNHCPFVKHIADELARFAREYREKGLGIVAIQSNDVANYPDDAPDKMKAEAARRGYEFPYLHDADQSVAKAYRAACTPDFFLFGRDHRLAYRGQFDGARPGSPEPVTGEDLRRAADLVLAGRPAPAEQAPSIGCNIKWIPGREPDYAR